MNKLEITTGGENGKGLKDRGTKLTLPSSSFLWISRKSSTVPCNSSLEQPIFSRIHCTQVHSTYRRNILIRRHRHELDHCFERSGRRWHFKSYSFHPVSMFNQAVIWQTEVKVSHVHTYCICYSAGCKKWRATVVLTYEETINYKSYIILVWYASSW